MGSVTPQRMATSGIRTRVTLRWQRICGAPAAVAPSSTTSPTNCLQWTSSIVMRQSVTSSRTAIAPYRPTPVASVNSLALFPSPQRSMSSTRVRTTPSSRMLTCHGSALLKVSSASLVASRKRDKRNITSDNDCAITNSLTQCMPFAGFFVILPAL